MQSRVRGYVIIKRLTIICRELSLTCTMPRSILYPFTTVATDDKEDMATCEMKWMKPFISICMYRVTLVVKYLGWVV